MLVSRVARQVVVGRPLGGSIPLCRKLSIVAARQGGFLQHTNILGVNTALRVPASRAYSLWWGQSKPSPSNAAPDVLPTAVPEPAPVSAPVEPVEPVEPVVTASTEPNVPPFEATQAESSLIPPELVSSTSSTLDTLAASPATHQLGDFAAQGFGGLWPSGMVQTALEFLHVQVGLPWWLSILVLTAFVRSALLPLNLSLVGNASRMARIQPQLTALTDKMKHAREAGDTATLQHTGLKAQKLLRDANANPLKGLLGPLIQMPIALSFFFGIRNLCNAGLSTLQHGGIAWFTDLTVPDPTWALPILSSASMLVLLQTTAMDGGSGAAAHTRNFFRVLSILTIPLVSYLPSGVLVYFVANGAFMLVQNALVGLPEVRQRYKIVDRPAPPPDAAVTKSPTFRDSLRALRSSMSEALEKAREQQEAEARARARSGPQVSEKKIRTNSGGTVRAAVSRPFTLGLCALISGIMFYSVRSSNYSTKSTKSPEIPGEGTCLQSAPEVSGNNLKLHPEISRDLQRQVPPLEN